MSAGSEAVMVDGGLVDCGAVREMEVCWPSRVVLRKKALNRVCPERREEFDVGSAP
jgi:hypothetical protein